MARPALLGLTPPFANSSPKPLSLSHSVTVGVLEDAGEFRDDLGQSFE